MTTSAATESVLVFSDVHFDPFADPALVPALAAADVSQWKTLFAASDQTVFSAYGTDTNYALLESALDSNNPGYEISSYDTVSGELLAKTTFSLDLAAPASGWSLEYDFAAVYGTAWKLPWTGCPWPAASCSTRFPRWPMPGITRPRQTRRQRSARRPCPSPDWP